MPGSRSVKAWPLRIADCGDSAVLQPDPVTEVKLDNDNRMPVQEKDHRPGGEFRFVVKLTLGFEGQLGNEKWFSSTGWLIRNDILVTAGHCVYMHNRGQPHVVSIKACLGYHGRNSGSQDDVEVKYGCRVVTPTKWTKEQHIPHDVAFIHLAEKFNNVTKIAYEATPTTLTGEELSVVGYSGDLPTDGEGGSLIYVGTGLVSYDLNKSYYRGMLEYKISTFTGSSGSPVLRQENGKLVVIGTHRGGSNVHEMNMATAIGRTIDTDIRYDMYELFLDGVAKGRLELNQTPRDYDLANMRSLAEETVNSVLSHTT